MKKSGSGVKKGGKVKNKAAGHVTATGDLLNSRLLQVAVAAAIGTTLGRDAFAATTSPPPDASAAKDFDAEATRAERAEAEENAAAPEANDKSAADHGEKTDGAKELAEVALDPEQIAKAEQGEVIVVADASDAIGVQTDQPMQLAADTTQAASAKAGSAKGAASSGAASGEAAGASAAGEAAAGSAAADAAGAAIGAAGAAGVSPIAIAAVGVGAAAAAGGGGGGAAAAGGGVAAAGFAAKGILSGATVFYDFNGDGKLSAGDASATTAANGSYSISLTSAQATQVATGLNNLGGPLKLIVAGGTDTVAGTPFTGVLSAVAPTNVAAEAKITLYSTLEASGMAKSAITEMLGGTDYTTLDEDAFDNAGDPTESLAIQLFGAIQSAITAANPSAELAGSLSGDVAAINAELMDAVMGGVTSFLEVMATKGDLETMISNLATAGQLDDFLNAAVDTALDTMDAVLTSAGGDLDALSGASLTDMLSQMDAVSDASLTAFLASADGTLNALVGDLADGDIDAAPDFSAAVTAAGNAATAATNATDELALATEYGASLKLAANTYTFQGFVLDEAAASALADRIASGDVAADPFGANAVYLQVEGTLLGTADNPLTYGQLQALGVTVIQEDAYAPYLRLTNENVADGSELDSIVGLFAAPADAAGIAGADGLVYYAEGTALDYSGDISGGVDINPTLNDAGTAHADASLDDLLTYYNFDIGT